MFLFLVAQDPELTTVGRNSKVLAVWLTWVMYMPRRSQRPLSPLRV